MLGVALGCLRGVVRRMMQVAMRDMGVMRGGLVVAGFVVLLGGLVVPRCMLVMLGGLAMMLDCVLRHGVPHGNGSVAEMRVNSVNTLVSMCVERRHGPVSLAYQAGIGTPWPMVTKAHDSP